MDLKIGKDVILHSYKHDKTIHRVWKHETIIENNDDYLVLANKRTKVVEANGRFWYTREPSVAVFFKHHWYNVIGIIKADNIYFYCNLSSPVLCDDEAIKYIDYDLDIKVNPDFTYKLLDYNEFKRHRREMDYPEDLDEILFAELEDLKKRIHNRDLPFDKEMIRNWYIKFQSLEEKR